MNIKTQTASTIATNTAAVPFSVPKEARNRPEGGKCTTEHVSCDSTPFLSVPVGEHINTPVDTVGVKKKYLTSREVCEHFGISYIQLANNRSRMVGAVQFGRLWKYDPAIIAAHIARTGKFFRDDSPIVQKSIEKRRRGAYLRGGRGAIGGGKK